MEIASLILSIIALILSIASIIWQVSKHLSSHTIQYVNPFDGKTQDPLSEAMGKDPKKEFREIGDPLDEDELEYIERMKEKKAGRL
jgi:hypothetical protein